MDQQTKRECLNLIQKLQSHSIAEIFISPVDPDLDNVPDYFEKIKSPSDLSTVKKNLNSNHYQSIDEFIKDVDQIWENASLYNGPFSLPAVMGRRLSNIFHRGLEKIKPISAESWINKYLQAQTDFSELFKKQPGMLKSFNLTPELETLVPDRHISRTSITSDDIKIFSESFKLVENPSHVSKIISIINDNEQGIDLNEEEVKINLTTISPRTVRLLKTWTSEVKDPQKNISNNPEI